MIQRFLNDENGQGMVEYILIVALIAIAAIVAVKMFGGQLQGLFSKTAKKIQSEGDKAIGE